LMRIAGFTFFKALRPFLLPYGLVPNLGRVQNTPQFIETGESLLALVPALFHNPDQMVGYGPAAPVNANDIGFQCPSFLFIPKINGLVIRPVLLNPSNSPPFEKGRRGGIFRPAGAHGFEI